MESIVVRSLPPNVVLSHAHLGALFGQRPVPQVRGSGIPHASATKSVKVVNVASGKSISVGVFGPSSSGTTTRVQLSGTALRRIGLEAPTRLSRSLKGKPYWSGGTHSAFSVSEGLGLVQVGWPVGGSCFVGRGDPTVAICFHVN